MEGLRLRVKDIDFSGKNIIIRDAKGQQDRITMLPQQLIEPLKQQLNYPSFVTLASKPSATGTPLWHIPRPGRA